MLMFEWYRYLMQNMDWLEEELGGYEDDYLIIDCPGEAIKNIIMPETIPMCRAVFRSN